MKAESFGSLQREYLDKITGINYKKKNYINSKYAVKGCNWHRDFLLFIF